MRLIVRALVFALAVTGMSAAVAAQQQPPPAPPAGQTLQQEGFTPVDELPPQDQLPSAPLLIAAYAFVLLVLFAYVYSVARRLNSVHREVERLEGDLRRGARG